MISTQDCAADASITNQRRADMVMSKWIGRGSAYCQKCDWGDEFGETTVRMAREHYNKTGHKVNAMVDLHYIYSNEE